MSEARFQKTKTSAKTGAGIFAASALFIGGWEGYRRTAVHERIDPPGVVTVCNGITNFDIPTLKVGDKFSDAQCREMFAKALPKYDADVRRCIKVPMSDNTHIAMLSFTYNVGGGAFCKSSVVRKINAGDLEGGCKALLLYTRANGKFVQGLLNRRMAEQKLCLSQDPGAVTPKPKPAKPPMKKPEPPPPQNFFSWLFGWMRT